MNLLVTGAWKCSIDDLNRIKALGHRVFFQQMERNKLVCPYEFVEGVICNGLFLYHAIDKFVNLKYIQLTSAGFDRVPMEYVGEHGIEIYNAKDVYSIPMAEYAVGGVLQLYKQSRFFYNNQAKRVWNKNRKMLELHGKMVCIVGCGNVGIECAKRFKAFGCNVVGVNRTMKEADIFEKIFTLDELDVLLPVADIIILAIAASNETRHLVNKSRIKKLKSSAVIVNIARGSVLETEALVRLIDKIGGAVLDVFEEEPLDPYSLLWEKENVIITPHNSFVGDGNPERIRDVIMKNLEGEKK